MAGISGGGQHPGHASEGLCDAEALADTTRALLVALCAGFAAQVPAEHFSDAKVELDAVRAALEDVTNRLIDAGAEIDAIAKDVDESARDRLVAATAAIYETMSFQDITGQRMSKVERILTDVQASLAGGAPLPVAGPKAANEDDAPLCGPQLPGNAIEQDEIDAILAGSG